MSNSVLTKKEREIISDMIDYLRYRGNSRLADRCERVFLNCKAGVYTRRQILSGVIREAAFRAIRIACQNLDSKSVLDFSVFLELNGELSRNKTKGCLAAFASSLDDLPG